MVANILSADPSPTPDPGVGVKRSKFYLTRTLSGCISSKGNHEMQQHGRKYFACRPPPTQPQYQLFQNIVMLHNITLKGITKLTAWLQIFCPKPPPPTTIGDGLNRSKLNLFITWSRCISNEMESLNVET